jgi:hypothetical protein
MPARDASGVPLPLRELIDALAELAETPYPADGNYKRHREVRDRRRVLLETRLTSLADQLRVGDKYPSVAAESLARFCELRIPKIRERLAEPLGYEPERDQGGDEEETGGN